MEWEYNADEEVDSSSDDYSDNSDEEGQEIEEHENGNTDQKGKEHEVDEDIEELTDEEFESLVQAMGRVTISAVEVELSLFTPDPLHNGIADACHERTLLSYK
jgi:hypothetical protein